MMSAEIQNSYSTLPTAAKSFNDPLDDTALSSTVFLGDAGTQPDQYYRKKLSPFRNRCRNLFFPLIKAETPILAWIQGKFRHPLLDSYFVSTANLGSHTFYVLFLPLSFWLGYPFFGWNLFFELAMGVYITNFFKDYFCLPRPRSPPLKRLTMSKDAALEYGFPSTHTANAVSVFLLVSDTLRKNYYTDDPMFSRPVYILLNAVNIAYILSLVAGRIYCGMHGFWDLLGGSTIGTVIFLAGPICTKYIFRVVESPSYWILLVIPIILCMIGSQPRPADCCPCFDDSIAFLGVLTGVVLSQWSFLNVVFNRKTLDTSINFENNLSWLDRFYMHTRNRYYLEPGVLKHENPNVICCLIRVVIGITMVLIWKVFMKKLSMSVLTFVWRKLGIEKENSKILKANAKEETNMEKVNNVVEVHQTSQSVFKHRVNSNSGATSQKQGIEPDTDDLLLIKIPFRSWYDAETISKLIVYSGIAWIVLGPCRYLFAALDI